MGFTTGNTSDVTTAVKADAITIGATDLEGTRRFYEQGLGCPVTKDGGEYVTYGLGADTSELTLHRWDALAEDAGVPAASAGFRGFTMNYVVDTADEVDAVLERATRAARS